MAMAGMANQKNEIGENKSPTKIGTWELTLLLLDPYVEWMGDSFTILKTRELH